MISDGYADYIENLDYVELVGSWVRGNLEENDTPKEECDITLEDIDDYEIINW